MLDACVDFECRPDLVAEARAFIRETLNEWELASLTDDAVLVASELIGNAVLHARTAIRLRLLSDGLSSVRVEVRDENTRMPTVAACPEDATSGRGLNLVAALCGSWGSSHDGDGKVVWAQVGTPAAGDGDDVECADLSTVVGVDDALNGSRGSHPEADTL